MEENAISLSWKDLYEQLCDLKPSLFLNILDSIAFDTFSLSRPVFWLRTCPEGYLQCRNMRNLTIDDAIQLAVMSTGITTQRGGLVESWEDSKEIVAVGVNASARFALTPKALISLPVLLSTGLDGLVILKSPGKQFDRRVLIHDIRVQKSLYEDTIKVRSLYNMSQEGVHSTQSRSVTVSYKPS
jgi:hypothetical protein